MIEKLKKEPITWEDLIYKLNELIDTINEQGEAMLSLDKWTTAIVKDMVEQNKKIDFIMENTGKESLYSEVSGATRREYKTLKKLYSE